jgi:hypothetical protein
MQYGRCRQRVEDKIKEVQEQSERKKMEVRGQRDLALESSMLMVY